MLADGWKRFEKDSADLAWKKGRKRSPEFDGESLVKTLLQVETGVRNIEEACHAGVRAEMVHFVVDVFGDPFRPLDCAATWLTPTVTALAQAICRARRFARAGRRPTGSGLRRCRDPGAFALARSTCARMLGVGPRLGKVLKS